MLGLKEGAVKHELMLQYYFASGPMVVACTGRLIHLLPQTTNHIPRATWNNGHCISTRFHALSCVLSAHLYFRTNLITLRQMFWLCGLCGFLYCMQFFLATFVLGEKYLGLLPTSAGRGHAVVFEYVPATVTVRS